MRKESESGSEGKGESEGKSEGESVSGKGEGKSESEGKREGKSGKNMDESNRENKAKNKPKSTKSKSKVNLKVREELSSLSPYKPGKSVEYVKKKYGIDAVKLASNENPYGASPKAVEAFKAFKDFNIYPDPDPEDLREKISEYTGWDKERIVIGAGLDGVLENVFKIFVSKGDEVVIPIPSFPYYHILSKVFGAKEVLIQRKKDFTINTEKILESINKKTKIVIICSPNNPTGNVEREKDVQAIAESDVIVFIDEAYAEFSSKTMKKLADYENVCIGRTFSKAFGLANLRIGYAVVGEAIRENYMKVTTPFPISTPAKLAAMAALEDEEFLSFVVNNVVRERERLLKELNKWIKVYPSEANFLFAEVPMKSEVFVEELMKRGVIVRDCSYFTGCKDDHVRISVGKKEENDKLLNAIEDLLE